MPKPYECRNLIEVSLVAALLWSTSPAPVGRNNGEMNPNQTSLFG